MSNLKNELFSNMVDFAFLMQSFKSTYRTITVPTTGQLENSAEHSYDLAMMCMYVRKVLELDHLDLEKILIYSLVHDLVEVIVGDIDLVKSTEEQLAKKKNEEELAIAYITKYYTEIPELGKAIVAYESQEDEESRFVYAMDKFVPFFVEYGQNFSSCKSKGATRAEMMKLLNRCSRHPNVFYLANFFTPIIEEYFEC